MFLEQVFLLDVCFAMCRTDRGDTLQVHLAYTFRNTILRRAARGNLCVASMYLQLGT